MKKYLLLLIFPLLFSCTNYYYVTFDNDTPYYKQQSESGEQIFVIPANTPVFINGKNKKYRKVKYNGYTGYVVNPVYRYAPEPSGSSSTTTYRRSSSSSNSSSSSSKTVHVRGYTRKDGTYVKPHTRSAPKRRG